MGATLNVAKPKKGSTVAIFGLGGVGIAISTNSKCSLFMFMCIHLSFTVCNFFKDYYN